MPRQSPYRIVLSADEQRTLSARAAEYTRSYAEVLRAKMILLAAEGWSNDAIAGRLDTRREVVSLWRKRFFEQRLPGLEDRPRSGRPRAFSP
jgi:transposase